MRQRLATLAMILAVGMWGVVGVACEDPAQDPADAPPPAQDPGGAPGEGPAEGPGGAPGEDPPPPTGLQPPGGAGDDSDY